MRSLRLNIEGDEKGLEEVTLRLAMLYEHRNGKRQPRWRPANVMHNLMQMDFPWTMATKQLLLRCEPSQITSWANLDTLIAIARDPGLCALATWVRMDLPIGTRHLDLFQHRAVAKRMSRNFLDRFLQAPPLDYIEDIGWYSVLTLNTALESGFLDVAMIEDLYHFNELAKRAEELVDSEANIFPTPEFTAPESWRWLSNGALLASQLGSGAVGWNGHNRVACQQGELMRGELAYARSNSGEILKLIGERRIGGND